MSMVLVGSFAMATSISWLRLCALIQKHLKCCMMHLTQLATEGHTVLMAWHRFSVMYLVSVLM